MKKNPQMQEYMISRREEVFGEKPLAEEVPDQAAKNYRAMMMQKKEQNYKSKGGILSYLTSILTIIILCSVSVILLSGIRRMEDIEQTISVMSIAMESTEQEENNIQNRVAVETISGNVVPIEKDAKEQMPETEKKIDTKSAEILELDGESDTETAADLEEVPEAKEIAAGDTNEGADDIKDVEVPKEEEPAVSDAQSYLAQGYYIVQKGDSLRQICYRIYQTYAMIDKLCEANDIEDQDTIYAGQKIILPK